VITNTTISRLVLRLATVLALSIVLPITVHAAKWDSPKKTDEHDLVIPVVNKATGEQWSIVLRGLTVPGKEFWLSTERFIELGESGRAGVYERPVSVNVKGSLKTEGQWKIWIGKYETTVGQYAAVMGNGDIDRGLDLYIEYSNRDKSDWDAIRKNPKKLKTELAKPVDRLAPVYVQLFIRELNKLCLLDAKCRQALPGIEADSTIASENYLAFFRLPTEIEWEYAARGVSVKPNSYRDRLPVSAGKIRDYAVLDKISSIGRRKPIFGFYDLFGNVAELVSGRMTPEIGGTGAGSWLAKGGKAGATSKKPYTSQREEILEFEWRSEDEQPRAGFFNRVGFRLALGVPLQAFDKLASNERATGGETAKASTEETGDSSEFPVEDVEFVLKELSNNTGALAADQRSSLARRLDSALERLKKEDLEKNTRMAKFITDNTFTKVVRIYSLRSRIEKNTKFVKSIKPSSKKAKDKISSWRKQIKLDIEQTNTLLQEYEEGVSAIAAVPNIDASITKTIRLSGYQQSDAQIVLAETAKQLLADHIKLKKTGKIFDIRKEVDAAYPL